MVGLTDPYGRILGFLDGSRYFSIKLAKEHQIQSLKANLGMTAKVVFFFLPRKNILQHRNKSLAEIGHQILEINNAVDIVNCIAWNCSWFFVTLSIATKFQYINSR
jgi:hypothetical protein